MLNLVMTCEDALHWKEHNANASPAAPNEADERQRYLNIRNKEAGNCIRKLHVDNTTTITITVTTITLSLQ